MAKPHDALRAFGLQLRQAREDAGLGTRRLAELLSWPPSKISKLENGQQAATMDDVSAWATATGCDSGATRRLHTDLRKARQEYAAWRQRLASGTGARQQSQLRGESEATTIRAFEQAIIPGLLQTPDYARNVLTGVIETYELPRDVDEGVRVRLKRQEILYAPDKQLRFLIAEAALYCRMAPAEVMAAQLDRLLVVAGVPTVQVGIVPFTARYTVGPLNGFWIYDDSYVLVETLAAELTLTEPDEVALHVRIFDSLWKQAATAADARSLIVRASQHY